MDKYQLAELEPEPGVVLRYRRTAIVLILVVAAVFIAWGSLGVMALIQGTAPWHVAAKGILMSILGVLAVIAVINALIRNYRVVLGETKLQMVAGGSRIVAQLPYYNIASMRLVKSMVNGRLTLEVAIADQDDYETAWIRQKDRNLIKLGDVFVVPLDQLGIMIEQKRQEAQKKESRPSLKCD